MIGNFLRTQSPMPLSHSNARQRSTGAGLGGRTVQPGLSRPGDWRRCSAERGFTLVEMLAVVILITILALLAIPNVTRQLRDRRTLEAAQQISQIYQNARLRAMGRGSAVLVRFVRGSAENARYEVYEAQRGTTDAPTGTSATGCSALPIPSCLTPDWNTASATDHRSVNLVRFGTLGNYDDLNVTMSDSASNAASNLDVCFTPMGRTYARTNGTLAPLTEAYAATVFRGSSVASAVGRYYKVLVLPTGIARVLQ